MPMMNFPSNRLATQRRRYDGPVRTIPAVCSLVFVGALVCSLPQHVTPAVEASSPKPRDLGAALFHEKGCEHCHGADGRGGERGPDLSTIGKRWKKPQIEHQIHDGGANMPAFGEALQPDEIKDLVEYLHTKRKAPKQQPVPVKPAPEPVG